MIMKKLICLWVLLFATNAFAGGASVDFTWLQAPDLTWGTKIYVSTIPGPPYENSEDAGINTTAYQMQNLLYGTTYYFTAAHYDSDGFESDYAPEVSWTSPGVPGVSFNPLPVVVDSGVQSYTITLTIPVP